MCGDYFNEKALKNQGPPVKNYDIHIYFDPAVEGSELKAASLSWEIQALFPKAVINGGVGKVGIVGPHAAPNYEVDIKPEHFGEVVSWLQRNGKGLSILVHPHTGDVVKDHLESSLWLGKQLEYNNAFFEARKPAANQNRQPKL